MDLKHLSLLFVELGGINIKGNVKSVDAGKRLPFRTAGYDLGMRVFVGTALLIEFFNAPLNVGIIPGEAKVGIKSHLRLLGAVGETNEDLFLEYSISLANSRSYSSRGSLIFPTRKRVIQS